MLQAHMLKQPNLKKEGLAFGGMDVVVICLKSDQPG